MLFTVNKVKYMELHKLHASQKNILKNVCYAIFVSLSNKTGSILVTRFVENKLLRVGNKNFYNPSRKEDEKSKRKKEKRKKKKSIKT